MFLPAFADVSLANLFKGLLNIFGLKITHKQTIGTAKLPFKAPETDAVIIPVKVAIILFS